MKSKILQITLIGLMSIPLFGCGNKEEKNNSSNELKGVCKEAYEAMMNDGGGEALSKNNVTQKEAKQYYAELDEDECRSRLKEYED